MMVWASVCTSWCLVSSSVLVGQSFFTSMRLFTLMPRSARRRHYMHQHLQPLSSSSFAPVDLQAFPTVESFRPPLVPRLPAGGPAALPPAVNHAAAPPPSPGAGIVPLVGVAGRLLDAACGGLIVTPATISSPAAVPAFQRLVSTLDDQLGHPVPHCTCGPVTVWSLRLFATSSLDIALRSPSSSTPIIVVALALPELPSGACSPSSRASAGPLLGHRVVRARRHSRIAQIEYQGHNLATKGIPEFMTANLLIDAVI